MNEYSSTHLLGLIPQFASIRRPWALLQATHGHSILPALGLSIFLTLAQANVSRAGEAETGNALSEAAARALEVKIQALEETKPDASYPPMVITETEANSYLKFRGHEFVPANVHDPELHITPTGVSGAAEVDFDQLNQPSPRSDDWASKLVALVFRGKQHVQATGKLETSEGMARVTIESVTIGNSEIPAWLVEPLIEDYIRTRYQIDLSKPIALPNHITHIELGAGQATLQRAPK